MREDSKLKMLRFIFRTDLKKTTADNYERIINTINFMINQNCRKSGPKSVSFKHVYLSKAVGHQPNYAFRKPPLGEDKKGYWNFLWVGYLYNIDKRQLVMSYLKEAWH
jgi:hypothetical protein